MDGMTQKWFKRYCGVCDSSHAHWTSDVMTIERLHKAGVVLYDTQPMTTIYCRS